jgi:hypothetical protein
MMALIEEISNPKRPPPITATAAMMLMFPTVYMAAAHHPAGKDRCVKRKTNEESSPASGGRTSCYRYDWRALGSMANPTLASGKMLQSDDILFTPSLHAESVHLRVGSLRVGVLHVGSPLVPLGENIRALLDLLKVICFSFRLRISCGAHIPIWSCLQS